MFRNNCLRAAHEALDLDFPARICDGPALTPQTGAPYLIPFPTLYNWLSNNPSRNYLFGNLLKVVDIINHAAEIPAIMVGGSILKKSSLARDIDCIIFYKMKPGHSFDEIKDVRYPNVDTRFVPLDISDDAVIIKMIGYFTLLYSIKRGGSIPTAGPVIVEPPFIIPEHAS